MRSEVSRLYYSAFGFSSRYAQNYLGFAPTGKPDDHGLLKRTFKRNRRERVGEELGRLREMRNQCDYSHELIENLEAMLKDAAKIHDYINKALPPPAKK